MWLGMGRSCGKWQRGCRWSSEEDQLPHVFPSCYFCYSYPCCRGGGKEVWKKVLQIGMGGEGCAEAVGGVTVVGWCYSAVGSACSMGSGPTRVLLLQHFLIAYTRGMMCTYPHIQLSSPEKVCGMHTRVKPQEHAESSRARELEIQ